MATLEQRLAKLEAVKAGRGGQDGVRQAAMGRVLKSLREALPDDQPRFGEPGFVGLSDYRWHSDKLQALAGRIETGEVTEEDRMLLDALPHEPALGMTAPELVTLLAEVESSY